MRLDTGARARKSCFCVHFHSLSFSLIGCIPQFFFKDIALSVGVNSMCSWQQVRSGFPLLLSWIGSQYVLYIELIYYNNPRYRGIGIPHFKVK